MQGTDFFLEAEDYTASHEKFKIVKCRNCGFLYTNPRPDIGTIGSYYKSENYISHSDTSKGLVNKLYKIVRTFTLKSKLKLVSPFIADKRLLDIGAGTGAFINEVKQAGYNVIGIEPDADAVKVAQTNYSIKLLPEAELLNLEPASFDVITMWHVLEHVPLLHKRIEELKTLLSPNGAIFIAVPNHESYDASYYREHWAAYDVPRHLYHFDKQTIVRLFDRFNLELYGIKTMPFDGFYVSMLSEQYKSGRMNMLKGFLTGFKSMISGRRNNTSSLIYIFRHKGIKSAI